MIALDTSFLLIAEGRHDARKWGIAQQILARLSGDDIVVPAQALAEMLHVLKTILSVSHEDAGVIAARWLDATHSAGISAATIARAKALEAETAVGLENALLLVAAEENGATLLLSEDIQDGFTHGDLTVATPFIPIVHPRLQAYLGAGWNA